MFIATRIHPAAVVNITLNVSKFSFRTDAQGILSPSNEKQLLVSGTGSLQLQLSGVRGVSFNGSPLQVSSLGIQGEPSAACSFYQVRSSGVELAGPSLVTLEAPRAGRSAFTLKTHGGLSGNLTSRPSEQGLSPGFDCTRVHVNEGPLGDVEGSFSPLGGDSAFLAADSDVRFDFVFSGDPEIGDTQIPVFEEIRFSEIEPGSSEEKTVLLQGKNEVAFEQLDKKVTLDDADLLVVVPKSDFYLRRFSVKDGIHLSLHGVARDVLVGAGVNALENRMPSLFDHLDNEKRFYGVIPALVALIVGILDKMGILEKKK